MKLLIVGSIISIGLSLALTFEMCKIIFCAMIHKGKITLDFNKYGEGLYELIFCVLVLILAVLGIFYLSRVCGPLF